MKHATGEPPSARAKEIDELQRENASLDEQVKYLVQLEQSLSRSQNRLDRQLTRVRVLSRLAVSFKHNCSAPEVVALWAESLRRLFRVEHVVVLDGGDLDAVSMSSRDHGCVWHRSNASLVAMKDVVLSSASNTPPATRDELVQALSPQSVPEDATLVSFPIKTDDGHHLMTIVTVTDVRGTGQFFYDPPEPSHLPFLRLVRHHIERAVGAALATDELTRRGDELSSANTQLQASLERLEKTQRELLDARKMKAIGRLAGGIAHDFNNLLTVICSSVALLQDDAADELSPPERHDELAAISAAADRATGLTRQLLTFSRRQPTQLESLDASKVVDELALILRRLIAEDITLELELGDELPPIVADRGQLGQVVLNLVTNARDAVGSGGRITIETTAAVSDGRQGAQIVVQDDGAGIDEATRQRIFEPFYTTKGQGQGTGMGLATVYGIVSKWGGLIDVQSRPGEGARFRVWLPAGTHETEKRSPPTATQLQAMVERRTPVRILVVEDEPMIRHVTTTALKRRGYDVKAAEDGEAAVALIAENAHWSPELVITDVIMPRKNGVETVVELRQRIDNLRVLFTSGYTGDQLSARGFADVEAEFLPKPYTPPVLLARVAEMMCVDFPLKTSTAPPFS